MTIWDRVSNVAVVVMCLVTMGVAADHFLIHNQPEEPDPLGKRLTGDLRDLLAPGATATAIVVVASNCKYCIASIDFYQRLAALQESERGAFQVTFVGLLDQDDARMFMRKADLPLSHVRPTTESLRDRVKGTPTLIVANSQGSIVGTWTGQLTSRKEKSVFTTIDTVLRTQSAPSGTPNQ